MNAAQLRHDVRRYVTTGEHDPMGRWGGSNLLEGFHGYGVALREALVAEVHRRERGHTVPELPADDRSARPPRCSSEPLTRIGREGDPNCQSRLDGGCRRGDLFQVRGGV
jgi:hypothetical protein